MSSNASTDLPLEQNKHTNDTHKNDTLINVQMTEHAKVFIDRKYGIRLAKSGPVLKDGNVTSHPGSGSSHHSGEDSETTGGTCAIVS